MGIIGTWLSENWFDALTIFTGLGGLWFAGFAIHRDAQARKDETKARRAANLLTITANHRELWNIFIQTPAVWRVVVPTVDLVATPVTLTEEYFVNMVISHTSSVYETLKDELLIKQAELRRDAQSFFSLPIPRAVWSATKRLQNQDFAAYIDSSLKND